MKKKLASILLSILFVLSFSGCSFSFKNYDIPLMQYGDFLYCNVENANSNRKARNGDYIAILQLTDEASQKERLIVPDMIDGKPVVLIGMRGFMGGYDITLSGERFKKLYLPPTMQRLHMRQEEYRKIFFIEDPKNMQLNTLKTFFTTEDIYRKYSTQEIDCTIKIANVQYICDGEVYWIDDYRDKNGVTIMEPPMPEKEGFIFEGWYKEEDCINKWDFETDLHIYDSSNSIMNLYAKWIEQ